MERSFLDGITWNFQGTSVTVLKWLDLGVAKNHKTIEDSQKSSYVQYSRQVELDIRLKIGMIALISTLWWTSKLSKFLKQELFAILGSKVYRSTKK